tara:strand:- start:273 stop:821 length:549 start_codon:yes stop_codon:yes gene_type:complete
MKQKKPNSKLQAILFERGIKIVDLYNKIEEENDKPVAKYMISQIVNGKRTNYEIITLNKICKALGVSPNAIIEENPTRFSVTAKSIKSNTKKEKKKSTLSPKMEKHIQEIADEEKANRLNHELNILMEGEEPMVEHDGMRYNPENAEETLEFTDEQNHITRKNTDYSPPEEEIEEEDDDFGF